IAVDTNGDPGVFGLDARPFELHVLENVDRHVHFLVRGLERGQVDLTVTLCGMGIAGPKKRALYEDRYVERRAFGQIAYVDIAGITSGRHRAILTRLRARDADRAGEGSEWNLDP